MRCGRRHVVVACKDRLRALRALEAELPHILNQDALKQDISESLDLDSIESAANQFPKALKTVVRKISDAFVNLPSDARRVCFFFPTPSSP